MQKGDGAKDKTVSRAAPAQAEVKRKPSLRFFVSMSRIDSIE